jgi:hypothetical protein
MRTLLTILLAGVASLASAQVNVEKVILSKYDLDSASYIYCTMSDLRAGPGRIETSGTTATVTTVATYTDSFTDVGVGDEIVAQSVNLAAPVVFTVTARASATSITADRTINLDVTAGASFTWRKLSCGTGAGDGWFTVPAGTNHLAVVWGQGDLTDGLDVSIETRYRGSYGGPLSVLTYTIAAATGHEETAIVEESTDWRVGLKYHTADASDAAANLEQIGIVLWSEKP